MKLHSFGYLFGEGVRSIFRHKLMSFASIGVLTACLVLIGASVLLTVNINALVGGAEQENEIIAFLDDFEKEE
ncbi:MAG: ABC transporter permease, partial [Oscillospiraceae bacterium]|nr:ABC transporter permease [Oscillospiraceae bacterium]